MLNKLEIGDLWAMSNFLSMIIKRPCRDMLLVSQEFYIEEFLKEFSVTNYRGLNVEKLKNDAFTELAFRKAVGSLMYL